VPARLLFLCLLLRSSWLTVEGGRQIGAARVLHRRGGRAAVAVSVGMAVAFLSDSGAELWRTSAFAEHCATGRKNVTSVSSWSARSQDSARRAALRADDGPSDRTPGRVPEQVA
jgi:hypothetical protein